MKYTITIMYISGDGLERWTKWTQTALSARHAMKRAVEHTEGWKGGNRAITEIHVVKLEA